MPPEAGQQGDPSGDPQGDPEHEPNTGDPGKDPKTGKDGEPFDAERAKALIDKLRPFERASKEQAKRIAELEAKLKEHDDAKLSETEKLQAQLSALEAEKATWERERREFVVRQAITTAATTAGALYPDALWKLVDFASLEFSDDGQPTNADKTVEEVKERYPALFGSSKPGSADGGPRGGATGGDKPNMNDLLRAAATGKE